jgi:hypothetical protein
MSKFILAFLFAGKAIPWNIYSLEKNREGLIQELKNHGDLVVAGDGRHDSMGHSAKYCAYTVFCCTVPFIIHFALVQVCYLESTVEIVAHYS